MKHFFLKDLFVQKMYSNNWIWIFSWEWEKEEIYLFVKLGFPQRDWLENPDIKTGSFLTSPVNCVQNILGIEKNPDSSKVSIYAQDEHGQDFSQNVYCFGYLTTNDLLQPYISPEYLTAINVNAAGQNSWDVG